MKVRQPSKPLIITLPSGQIYHFNIAAEMPEQEAQLIAKRMKQWLMKTLQPSGKA